MTTTTRSPQQGQEGSVTDQPEGTGPATVEAGTTPPEPPAQPAQPATTDQEPAKPRHRPPVCRHCGEDLRHDDIWGWMHATGAYICAGDRCTPAQPVNGITYRSRVAKQPEPAAAS